MAAITSRPYWSTCHLHASSDQSYFLPLPHWRTLFPSHCESHPIACGPRNQETGSFCTLSTSLGKMIQQWLIHLDYILTYLKSHQLCTQVFTKNSCFSLRNFLLPVYLSFLSLMESKSFVQSTRAQHVYRPDHTLISWFCEFLFNIFSRHIYAYML